MATTNERQERRARGSSSIHSNEAISTVATTAESAAINAATIGEQGWANVKKPIVFNKILNFQITENKRQQQLQVTTRNSNKTHQLTCHAT